MFPGRDDPTVPKGPPDHVDPPGAPPPGAPPEERPPQDRPPVETPPGRGRRVRPAPTYGGTRR